MRNFLYIYFITTSFFVVSCASPETQKAVNFMNYPFWSGKSKVMIISDETNARYCADGKVHNEIGRKVTINDLTEGRHKITVLASGYSPKTEAIDIDYGDDIRELRFIFTVGERCHNNDARCVRISDLTDLAKLEKICLNHQ